MREYNQQVLRKLQLKELEILKDFDTLCRKHDIPYFIFYGSGIGVLRHGGFIPWDDDIDVVIPRDDYNKLINEFINKIDHYILESPYSGNSDYLYSFAKLYDTDTTLTEKLHYPCRRGVYIDIFPLDGIGTSEEDARTNFLKAYKKNMFLMTRTCVIRKDRSWYKNASIIVSRLIPSFIVNAKKLSIEVDQLANSLNNPDSIYVANLMGPYRDKEIVKREFFGKPTLYDFENIKIFGPEKCDEYLLKMYGNWRKLPSKEKRKTNHDFYEIDLNKSYLE